MGKRPKSFCMGTKKEDVAERMTTTGTESKRIARSIKAQPVNSNLPFSTYEKTAAHLQMQIAIYRDESNWKQVYRLGLALGSLVQETKKKRGRRRGDDDDVAVVNDPVFFDGKKDDTTTTCGRRRGRRRRKKARRKERRRRSER